MNDADVLVAEYNNLWSEKLVHKASIRKFHNYLTYVTAAASLALTFHGVSATDFFASQFDPAAAKALAEKARSILLLLFVPLTPIVLITLTFPLNDMFHIYVIGQHIAQVERRLNALRAKHLLRWENSVCPAVYGGSPVHLSGGSSIRIKNVIVMGDFMLLIPALFMLCAVTTILGAQHLYRVAGIWWMVLYLVVVGYAFWVILKTAMTLRDYTRPSGLLAQAMRKLGEFPAAESTATGQNEDQDDPSVARQELRT